jgi:hypothetical protein
MHRHEKPAEVVLDGLSEIPLQLGVVCTSQASNSCRSEQESARGAEIASRRHHLIGRRCGGGISRQEIALAEHFGRMARLQMGVR